MVGVPRSTGCTLCVQRRVKCDQGKPGCGNCVKYGQPCPGYDRGAKFVDGKHRVRARRRQGDQEGFNCSTAPSVRTKSRSPDSWEILLRGSDPSTTSSAADGESPGNESASNTSAVPKTYSKDMVPLLPVTSMVYQKPVPNPPLPKSVLVANLMNNLRISTPQTEGLFFEHYIDASHLGKKELLDNALSAFTAHALGKAVQDEDLVMQSRVLYGKALIQLQRALNHPTEWKTPETLCSAMMCCTFELFAATERSDSWMDHANGVAWLIQTRGPSGYSTSWEKSMFLSFRGLIIMRSLFRLEECFLARRRWQKLLLSLAIEEEGDIPAVKYNKAVNLWMAHLARVPNVLRQGWALKEANDRGLPIDSAQAMTFAQETEALRLDAVAAYARLRQVIPEPSEIPSQDPNSPYPMILAYQNPWFGCILMGYWATMIILQESLNQCKWPIDFTKENKKCAINIYRSLETVGEGIMGPYRVGYAMRVSYTFAHVTVQRYMISLLRRYEKLYAAASVDSYPKVGENAYNYM